MKTEMSMMAPADAPRCRTEMSWQLQGGYISPTLDLTGDEQPPKRAAVLPYYNKVGSSIHALLFSFQGQTMAVMLRPPL